MAYLKIIKNGIASTIQDNGRFFFRESGIPVSGAFDKLSAQFANILLKNKVNTPVIEFFFSGPIIQFDVDVFVSVTGANINVYIDDNAYRSGGVYLIKSGSILNLSKFKGGRVGYLAIRGTWDIELIYGSSSTYTPCKLGGLSGRYLKCNDTLIINPNEYEIKKNILNKKIFDVAYFLKLNMNLIPFVKGLDWDKFEKKITNMFLSQVMEIDKESSRMGLRLKTINMYHEVERKHSIGVDEGIIQLPKNGLPIILMADGQITGGYPIIGFVPKYALSLLSQINIGQKFKFELISLERAKKNNKKMFQGINKFKKNYNLKYANK